MKVQIDILDDQLELLKKFQSLASVIKNHIGALPDSFKEVNGYVAQIDFAIANLEYKCRKWIIETSLMYQKIDGVTMFDNMKIIAKDGNLVEDEYQE